MLSPQAGGAAAYRVPELHLQIAGTRGEEDLSSSAGPLSAAAAIPQWERAPPSPRHGG